MTVNFKVDETSVKEFFDNLDSETLLMNSDRMLKEQQNSRVKHKQSDWKQIFDQK